MIRLSIAYARHPREPVEATEPLIGYDTSMRRVIVKLRGLRQARQRSGLSISQLADITDLRRDTITHLEHGKEEPQPYVLRRLATALNATTADLVGISVIESPPADHPQSTAPHDGATSLSAAAS